MYVSVQFSCPIYTVKISIRECPHPEWEDHPTSVNTGKITPQACPQACLQGGFGPVRLTTQSITPRTFSIPSLCPQSRFWALSALISTEKVPGRIFKAERFLLGLSHKLEDAEEHPGCLVPPVSTRRKNNDRMTAGIAKYPSECAISPSRLKTTTFKQT